MYALDFEYDNRYLSDFGFIICNFDSPSGADVVESGSKITFNTVMQNKGSRYGLTSTQYDECITGTFDICKNPDLYDDLEISNDEYLELVRWLNRKRFHKLHIIDDDHEIEPCFFEASFNISKVKIGEILYGLELEMTTDKPFGYGIERKITNTFASSSSSFIINDYSDEIGYIYPTLHITCNQSGDLRITNDLTGSSTYIKNCSKGEVITIDGSTLSISTSNSSHDICNDFNYNFFKIGNEINKRDNIIKASLPCTIEFIYSPIIKNSPN